MCGIGKCGHSHKNSYGLSEVCSTVEAQLLGADFAIADSEEVICARNDLAAGGESADGLVALAEALCRQQRYREAAACCERALDIDSHHFKARRMLAIRYMTTGRLEQSYGEFFKIRTLSDDKLDVEYRLGLCRFYMGDFEGAKRIFEECFELCRDNPEMYIAVLYWFVICAVRLESGVGEALKYSKPLRIEHHIGYDMALKLFSGTLDDKSVEISKDDMLTRVMYQYGLYHYYLWKGDVISAKKTFYAALDCGQYWASFSGLGVWYDCLRDKR